MSVLEHSNSCRGIVVMLCNFLLFVFWKSLPCLKLRDRNIYMRRIKVVDYVDYICLKVKKYLLNENCL